MVDIEVLDKCWNRAYEGLEIEQENHRIEFAMTRKCKCKDNLCKHYEAEKQRLFGKKINGLLLSGLLISAAAFKVAMNESQARRTL